MKVIVCGGRDFRDRDKLFWSLDFWLPRLGISMLIEGGQVSTDPAQARLPWEEREKWGADHFAGLWAKARMVKHASEPVTPEQWRSRGPAAGPMRNRRMLQRYQPQRVIAFPGGAGTKDMLDQARMAGVRCIEVA